MKFLKYIIPIFVGVAATSCDQTLTEINENPNASPSANPAYVLTGAQGYYAIALDAYFNQQDNLYAQYWAGGPGVALLDEERYFFEANLYNNEWAFSYNQALSDLKFVMENGNRDQAAVADVLSIMIWQNLVDHYGDIPYSEALKGQPDEGLIITPAYDDEQAIYADLLTRVDASIAVLENSIIELAEDDALPTVGEEDLIYEGDLDKWVRFANSLKLKLLMRQSIVNPGVGPQVVELIANGRFVEDESQMAIVPFSGETNSQFNPMFARFEAGVGQFYVASLASTEVMENLGDPRLEVLYDPASGPGVIVGLKQGDINDLGPVKAADFSFPTEVAYAEDNDVILMSHYEVMFLRSEAALRFGTADDDVAMFEAAVTAHFDYIGAEGAADYLAGLGYADAASMQAKLDVMGVQKWIAMNGLQEAEGWIEMRRFDVPETRIFTEGILFTPTRSVFPDGTFPNIRIYPQTEISFNPNSPKDRVTTDRVFWDN
jgi:hypothetical protein